MTAHGTAVFGEAVRMVGDALGIKLDEVRCDAEYAQTTEGVDLGSWTIPAVSRRKGQTLGRTGRSSKMAGSSK